MHKTNFLIPLLLALCAITACSGEPPPIPAPPIKSSLAQPLAQSPEADYSPQRLREVIKTLAPLHTPFGEPQPGDWILSHEEDGQTFEQYLKADPVTPQGKRRVLYVQPLGEFTPKQRKIIDLSAEYLGLYFNLPVSVMETAGLDVVPASAQRTHPSWGDEQVLSTWVLYEYLKPRLPEDAAAYIAFTSSDLYPKDDWNFVYGQASLKERVGVWSIYRNGNPDMMFKLVLLRTLKTATHETGHMFGLKHCTAYECNMCGCNNRDEGDRRPIGLCPECQAKVCWACQTSPLPRLEKLRDFCVKHGLDESASQYEAQIEALKQS